MEIYLVKNHVYLFDGKLRKPKTGGPIGLELTGQIAKIYMTWWDKQYLQKLAGLEITTRLYKRYVDDIFCLFKNEDDAEQFFDYLNNQHVNISFTYEK